MSELDRRLTVHALDLALGRPAVGLGLVVRREGAVLVRRATNADGRCDAPLLAGDAFVPGIYEIEFDVAGWRGATGTGGEAGFYDLVTIRFVVGEGAGHVHIPLLLSPYGYSTYRGS